jgi:hypothetical protein
MDSITWSAGAFAFTQTTNVETKTKRTLHSSRRPSFNELTNAKNLVLHSSNFASGDRGSAVVKVLCYKSEGHWFDPSWCHWNFSDCTMVLGSTQLLTERSTTKISWV